MGIIDRKTGKPNTDRINVFVDCWDKFIDWCIGNASAKILLITFSSLASSFLKDRWLDTPGRGEGLLCQSTTRHNWCTHLCSAGAIFFDLDKVFRKCKFAHKSFYKNLIPDWETKTLQIQNLGPLWRGATVKFWVGEGMWWRGFDRAFPKEDRLSSKYSLTDCNGIQICCLVDWWLYNTLSRQGEVVRTGSKRKSYSEQSL